MATGICTQNFMKIGPAVPEISSQTDRQTRKHTETDRQVDYNTQHPYRGGVIIKRLY